ncbi:hypothetical protein NDU88_005073 [Pleurodeles waltl]|uniref:C-type lectin domain-containing protein n=1 Tax=Pleurodeles waltl TaxID=8319 RepID=A0AAV7L6F8_PLEWA|nr:hypothetical protein NDU88_005073 [Pleurodeles waltl]
MESDITYAEVKFHDGSNRKAEIKTDAKTNPKAQVEKKTSPKILIALLLVILFLLAGLCVLITLYFQASSRVPELEKQMAQQQQNHTKVLEYIGCKNRTSAQICSQFFYWVCPINWQMHNGKCYLFTQTKLSWEKSRSFCQSSQADLVIIADKMEQLFISNTTKTDIYWIGLTDKDQKGIWKWVNDVTFQSPKFWNCQQPDNFGAREHCVTVGADGPCGASSLWNDAPCETEYKFICQKEAEDRKMDFTP